MKRQLVSIIGIVVAVVLLAGIFVTVSLSIRDDPDAGLEVENTSATVETTDSRSSISQSPKTSGSNKAFQLENTDPRELRSATSTSTSF